MDGSIGRREKQWSQENGWSKREDSRSCIVELWKQVSMRFKRAMAVEYKRRELRIARTSLISSFSSEQFSRRGKFRGWWFFRCEYPTCPTRIFQQNHTASQSLWGEEVKNPRNPLLPSKGRVNGVYKLQNKTHFYSSLNTWPASHGFPFSTWTGKSL